MNVVAVLEEEASLVHLVHVSQIWLQSLVHALQRVDAIAVKLCVGIQLRYFMLFELEQLRRQVRAVLKNEIQRLANCQMELHR